MITDRLDSGNSPLRWILLTGALCVVTLAVYAWVSGEEDRSRVAVGASNGDSDAPTEALPARLGGSPGGDGSTQSDAPKPGDPGEHVPPEGRPSEDNPVCLVWAGRFAEAIPLLRAEAESAADPGRRAALRDYLAVAILEGGTPSEVASYMSAWVARICTVTAETSDEPSWRVHHYNFWAQRLPDASSSEIRRRIASAMSYLRRPHGSPPSDARLRLLERMEKAEREADESSAAVLQGTRAFLALSEPYFPGGGLGATGDVIAAKMLPRVQAFIEEYEGSPEVSLRQMAAWLRARYGLRHAEDANPNGED